VKKSHFVIT